MSQWDDPAARETRAYPQQGYGQQQPYGQQPGYGPGGQPPQDPRRGHADTTANPFGAASDQAFGIVSTVLALLGGILGIVALTGLEWFKGGVDFSQAGSNFSGDPNETGFASAYFGWLAWTALIVAVIAGVMASFPSPALRAFRVIGVVIAFAMAGLSFLALEIDSNTSYTTVLKNTRIGFYLLVIAYILVGIGSAIGPRRV